MPLLHPNQMPAAVMPQSAAVSGVIPCGEYVLSAMRAAGRGDGEVVEISSVYVKGAGCGSTASREGVARAGE